MATLHKTIMRATSLLALCGLSAVSAQASGSQQVLTVAFIGYDNQSVDASVIGVQGQATTLSIACPSPTGDQDDTDCGIAPTQSLVIGPSTYSVYAAEGSDFVFTAVCTFSGSSSAVCDESAGGVSANDPGSSTTTYQNTDITYFPVTVTAGAELLSGSGGTAPATITVTPTNAASAGSTASNGAATSTGSGSSTSSTGTAAVSNSAASNSGSPTTSASSTSTSNAAVANALPWSSTFGVVGMLAGLLGLL